MANLAIDYASIDGNKPPDFEQAKAAGAKLVIPRGAYGRKVAGSADPNSPIYLDPVWNRDKSAIRMAGLKRSAYLFVCMPRKGYTTPEPEVQAQAFADYVSPGGVGNSDGLTAPGPAYCGDYVPVFDVEEQSSLPSEDYFQWILRAALTLRAHFGAWPIMYSSQRVWTEYLRNRPPGELQNCPQWVAKPWPWDTRTPAHLDGAPAWQPNTIDSFGDATNWLWYQYQGDATGTLGFSSTTDLSRVQTVAKGKKGDIVKWIQARIDATVDGDFGPDTESKLKAFQTKWKLTADGIFGTDTGAPMSWKTPPGC